MLKTKQVETVQHLASVLGRNRVRVQKWLSRYRKGGLEKMLAVGKSTGRTALIPSWAVERLKQELLQPEGFDSYEEVRLWLATELGIQVKYDVVHNLVHDKLKASLKVARPKSNDQEPDAIETFKKQLPDVLDGVIKEVKQQPKKFKRIRYWCEDETRLGLKTIQRRKLTSKGVKPVGSFQFRQERYYIYGLVEPKTGESLCSRNFSSRYQMLSRVHQSVFPGLFGRFTYSSAR